MSRSTELFFLFKRDFESLRHELKQFNPEEKLWKVTGSITNSAGNLCLHLCGNLRHYLGAVLGGSGYVRNRDAEFSHANLPLNSLLQLTDETERELENALLKLTDSDLEKEFPLEVLNRKWITETFILHLYGHFNYHLGQINYLRRVL
jgi:uncharacterized damage-inducible protein DinB